MGSASAQLADVEAGFGEVPSRGQDEPPGTRKLEVVTRHDAGLPGICG
ncbi:MAG TPA: hypothetical protein VG142_03200 [Trebonia sp.]|nr:hypothetical protein [Trebonia sp.]